MSIRTISLLLHMLYFRQMVLVKQGWNLEKENPDSKHPMHQRMHSSELNPEEKFGAEVPKAVSSTGFWHLLQWQPFHVAQSHVLSLDYIRDVEKASLS